MTWKKIIDNKLFDEYVKKAEAQVFVYVLYSTKYPYLPIDITYSLYEISVKYNMLYDTVLHIFSRKCSSQKHKFTIAKVYT